MSLLFRQVFRYVVQKAASDPQARAKAIEVAGSVVEQAKQIAKEKDRARAAGRAVRKAFDKIQNNNS